MRRGEIWTVAGAGSYAAKPRPVVILQDDRFGPTASVTICPFTSDATIAPLIRIPVSPTEQNGLRRSCSLMVDKITTISRSKAGTRIGRLADEEIVQLNRAVLVFLGIAASRSR
jgi:mRNA interferase MazF